MKLYALVRNTSTAVALLCYTATGFAPASRRNVLKQVSTADRKGELLQQNLVYLRDPTSKKFSVQTSLRLSADSFIDTKALTQYFFETLIAYGVPALVSIIVIGFAAKSFKNAGDSNNYGSGGSVVDTLYDDLYSDNDGGTNKLFSMFGGSRPNKGPALKNLGIPSKKYLSITKINEIYDSYAYSLEAATESKAKAAANFRSKSFNAALKKAVNSNLTELTEAEKTDLLLEEKEFLKSGGEILRSLTRMQKQLTDITIREEMDKMDVDVGEIDAHAKNTTNIIDAEIEEDMNVKLSTKEKGKKSEESSNALGGMIKSMKGKNKESSKILKEIERQNTSLLKLELSFIRAVIEIMGPDRANAIRSAILGNIEGGGAGLAGGLLKSLQERPLTSVLRTIGYSDDESNAGKRLFVGDFPGDVTASQVEDLREEVTAIIRSASPGDEALLVLQSGGGTVTGYGLAAAQLQRFKQNGIKLTICVEQVAASGGYMMTCVADKVIASPFAVLGSIGVISDLPNAYERLKKEGIEFQTVTAGKFKRTLTPTKKVTKEDIEKQKSDLEQILVLFKRFVHENRPNLDIESVATGETWFGEDAMEKGLCDEIKTVDDVLSEYVDKGFDVYEVKYDPEPVIGAGSLGRLLPAGKSGGIEKRGLIGTATRWFLNSVIPMVKEEVMTEINSSYNEQKVDSSSKYMIKDFSNTAERIRIED